MPSPNFSLAFQQMASFVAISKTKGFSEVLDELIKQCYVIVPEMPLNTPSALAEIIQTLFGLRISEKDVASSLKRLLKNESLVPLNGNQTGLSPALKRELESRISEARKLEEEVKAKWFEQLFEKNVTIDKELLWQILKAPSSISKCNT